MANQTYLQLVNYVLTQLRETTVSTVSYSAYSNLIGQWVNDAKQMVEDAWDWEVLHYTTTFNLIPGQLDYDQQDPLVTGGSLMTARARLRHDVDNPYRPMAFDMTTGLPMQLIEWPVDRIYRTRFIQPTPLTQTQPMFFGTERAVVGTLGVDNTVRVRLYETPLAVRNWMFLWTLPQADLVNDSDIVQVPWRPVAAMVIDRAMNERGEEIGEPGTTLTQRAQTHIDNAIGIDSRDQPQYTTFFPG